MNKKPDHTTRVVDAKWKHDGINTVGAKVDDVKVKSGAMKLEYLVKPQMSLEEFLRLYFFDEDGSITFERTCNGIKTTTRIDAADVPPFDGSVYKITIQIPKGTGDDDKP